MKLINIRELERKITKKSHDSAIVDLPEDSGEPVRRKNNDKQRSRVTNAVVDLAGARSARARARPVTIYLTSAAGYYYIRTVPAS